MSEVEVRRGWVRLRIDGWGEVGRGTYDDKFLLEVWSAMVELAGAGSAMVVEAPAVERVGGTGTGHGHLNLFG